MCYTIHNNTLGNCAHFSGKRETMTTKDYQTRRPLRIFLSYFRPHRGLFLLDISCAFLIAVIDLAFPLISRTAMYHWLPDKQFSIFFTVMALVVAAFVLRAGLYFIVGYWGHTFGWWRRISAGTCLPICRTWALTFTIKTAPAS